MVGDFSCTIVTIHNFRSLQDLPKTARKVWREKSAWKSARQEDQKSWNLRSCDTIARMHYEARECTSHPHTHRTHSIVISVLKDQQFIIINGDKQLLSTEVRESIEKYAAEEGIMILEE